MSRTQDDRLVTDYRKLPAQIRLNDAAGVTNEPGSSKVVSREVAASLAQDHGIDLILINKDANPPVYRLMDYGKFKYEEEKAARASAKKQRENARTEKEFWFNLNIGKHDYDVKVTQIKKALPDHNVRIGVKMNYTNKMLMPRGMPADQMPRLPNFVLKRVLDDLAGLIQPTQIKTGERVITADLRPV